MSDATNKQLTVGLVGRKLGMTRIFEDNGKSEPVTVIEVLPNYITQVIEKDNVISGSKYAVQLTTGAKKNSRVTKPMAGIFSKAGVEAGRGLWEFPLTENLAEDLKPGDSITVGSFDGVSHVDITGTSKGKGFAGVVKRHNFRTQDATHGNSLSHRAPGSIGQNQTPGRVFKGKKMAGHLGNVKSTTQNLRIVRIDSERNLLLVRGAVAGGKNADVIIRPAVKINTLETATA